MNRNDCNPIPCDCKDGKEGIQGLKGVDGDQGATGSVGLEGPIGPQGEQGIQGIDGEIGEQGIDGSDGTSTIVGPQGPQGPDGFQGDQGPDGADGNNGADGTDGTDTDVYSNIYHDNYCEQLDYGNACTDCIGCESWAVGASLNGVRHFNNNYGSGYTRIDLPPSPPIGARTQIVSFKGASGFKLRCHANSAIVEMAAFNSFIDNIAGPGPTGPPFPEEGVKFESPNGSDCIEVIHIGNNRWVISKINMASGQLPTFI